ncbi:MAG: hypothetical protein M3342_01100 [Bacteroidota bacterium]|nr:hypothetical protein [Bacteroidota bacterium]
MHVAKEKRVAIESLLDDLLKRATSRIKDQKDKTIVPKVIRPSSSIRNTAQLAT